MLKLFTLAGGLALAAATASAADLPVKVAKPLSPFAYPYEGSGFYYGIGTFGEAQSVQVNTPVVVGTRGYAAGAGGSLIGGYQRTFGGSAWVAAEVAVSYATTGVGCAVAGCKVDANFSATQKIKLGGPIAAMLAFLPDLSTSFPTLPDVPPGVGNPTTHPYVMLVAHESREDFTVVTGGGKKVAVRAGFGAGILTQLKAGMVLDTWAEVTFNAGSLAVAPGTTANAGGQARAGMSVLF